MAIFLPTTVNPVWFKNLYSVDFSQNIDDEGHIIYPKGKRHRWNVSLNLLSEEAAADVYQLEPRIKELLSIQRGAISQYKVPDGVIECGSGGSKGKGGDAFVGMLFAVDAATGKMKQVYIFTKKIVFCVNIDYAGSFKFAPVVDVMLSDDVLVYEIDVGAVKCEKQFLAESACWWATKAYLGRRCDYLCLQVPLGRIPSWGLSPAIVEAIKKLHRNHPAKALLEMRAGQALPVDVIMSGKWDAETKEAHYETLVAAGGTSRGEKSGAEKRKIVRGIVKGGGFTAADFETEEQKSAHSEISVAGGGSKNGKMQGKKLKTHGDSVKEGVKEKGGLKKARAAAQERRDAGEDTRKDRWSESQARRNKERPRCSWCKKRKPAAEFGLRGADSSRHGWGVMSVYSTCRDCRAEKEAKGIK